MSILLTIADWKFRVDVSTTEKHTLRNSTDHCLCAYCRNYYETVDAAQPRLRPVLSKFGIVLEGPSELMPLEPNVILACYRVYGEILHRGNVHLFVDDVRLFPEPGEDGSFLLWVGAMEHPWMQEEAAEEVISPANEPDFLDRMTVKWMELMDSDWIQS